MIRAFCLAALLAVMALPAPAVEPCRETACAVDGRSYHARLPESWDGARTLPVLLHFHGWGRTGRGVVRNRRIVGPAEEQGLLLLAPNGLGKSWGFWSGGARDIAFVERVIEDAASRWSIDRSRIYISGFSYGGAMAWRLACARGAAFAGYVAVAGGLPARLMSDCVPGPVRILHVHGRSDRVFGLPVGPGTASETAIAPWRRVIGAGEAPAAVGFRIGAEPSLACRRWDGRDGGAVTLCLHDRGHIFPKGWLGAALASLMAGES